MNPLGIIASIAGGNQRLLQMMQEAYRVAQGIQKSRAGILGFLNANNARIRDMLPYLNQGTMVRTILDNTFPGMASNIQEFGADLMREQEGPGLKSQQPKTSPTGAISSVREKFPPLKNRS